MGLAISQSDMNLRQLEILRSLVRHRTTVSAAKDLGLSQPAISNALKSMEAKAGFALFERINNRLFPTAEAMTLYKDGEAIFALHSQLESRVRDLKENRSGRLSIVATPPIAYGILPTALRQFMSARPATRVFFDVRRYEGTIEAVLNRSAELGFALGLSDHPGIACEIVHKAEMVCVFAPGHPLSLKKIVSANDLVDFPLIGLERGTRLGEALRHSFTQAKAAFRPVVEVRYCNTACVLAAARVGVAVVDPFSPRQGGSHDLDVRPFIPTTPSTAYMLWSEAQPLSRLARSFLDEVRKVSRGQADKMAEVPAPAPNKIAETASRVGPRLRKQRTKQRRAPRA